MKVRKYRWIVAAGVAAALAVSPTGATAMEVVFDPTNYAQAVEQVRRDVEMIRQLEAQVQNQVKMLQRWDYSQLPGILRSMGQLQQVFDPAGNVYSGGDPSGSLDQQFPPDPQAYENKTDADMGVMRDGWEREQRDVLVENRTIQNRVVQDLEPTAERIQTYVEKSNAAPGVTAAVQAGNEELATVVAKVQALQAMEISDARGDAQRDAQEQAEEAYGREQRAKVRGEWNGPSSSTAPVANPFTRAGE